MPLNVKKAYSFTPNPKGEVRLITRNLTRSRLAAGSFWRSREYGAQTNLIELIVETAGNSGVFIQHNKVFRAEEMIFGDLPRDKVALSALDLEWHQEVQLRRDAAGIDAVLVTMAWRTGVKTDIETLGRVRPGTVFKTPRLTVNVNVKLTDWPEDAVVYLRPRIQRTTLVPVATPGIGGTIATMQFTPDALRTTLNGSKTSWVSMPPRGSDGQDGGADGVLTPFAAMMGGGGGFPPHPVGLNTGPDRVLVHINYAEQEDGSMRELNQVFEWDGEDASIGSWQCYA